MANQEIVVDETPEVQDDPLLTVREVAKRLRVDGTTVRRWINTGALAAVELPHVGKRRGYRVKRSDLERTMNPAVIHVQIAS